MSKAAILSALSALAILSVTAIATPASAGRNNSDPIPPNCTLDPFTHTMNCHIWPTCTMDGHGKMVCPAPKASIH